MGQGKNVHPFLGKRFCCVWLHWVTVTEATSLQMYHCHPKETPGYKHSKRDTWDWGRAGESGGRRGWQVPSFPQQDYINGPRDNGVGETRALVTPFKKSVLCNFVEKNNRGKKPIKSFPYLPCNCTKSTCKSICAITLCLSSLNQYLQPFKTKLFVSLYPGTQDASSNALNSTKQKDLGHRRPRKCVHAAPTGATQAEPRALPRRSFSS